MIFDDLGVAGFGELGARLQKANRELFDEVMASLRRVVAAEEATVEFTTHRPLPPFCSAPCIGCKNSVDG